MNLDEAKYYEALGLTPPEEQETDQAGQEGGQQAGEDGAQERQPEQKSQQEQESAAEPEGGSETGEDEQREPGAEGGTENTGEGREQTAEQRRENAARRRREEIRATVDRAVQEALTAERERNQKELEDLFAAAGIKNTKTGAPIKTMEEFNAWKAEFAEQKLQNDLKAGKLTQEGLNAAISQHPAIRKAQEVIQREEQARQDREAAEAQTRIEAELAEIRKMDPTINEVADLLKMPNAKEFYEKVKKGYSFLDAFYLVNRERLAEQTAAAAREQAASNARGKDHLKGTGGTRGAGAMSVPPEEMRIFRAMMPDASDAEIQAYYNKKRGE